MSKKQPAKKTASKPAAKVVAKATPAAPSQAAGMNRAKDLAKKGIAEVSKSAKKIDTVATAKKLAPVSKAIAKASVALSKPNATSATIKKEAAKVGAAVVKAVAVPAKKVSKPVAKPVAKKTPVKAVAKPAAKKSVAASAPKVKAADVYKANILAGEKVVSDFDASTKHAASFNTPALVHSLPTNLASNPGERIKPQAPAPVFDIFQKPAFIQPITLSGKPLPLKQRKD